MYNTRKCGVAVFQVLEELLPENQSQGVRMLLHRAISLVKEDPVSALSVTLTIVDTPTSSPTLHRKSHKVAEESDPTKVSHASPFDNGISF